MKFSTKGRYALRMLIDLALHQKDGYVSLKDIAERQDISKKYLEQIIPLLNSSNILKTNRGAQGGYRLTKEPSSLTVGSILRLTEGGLAPISCLETDKNECKRASECMTLFVWEGLYRVEREYLDGITLQDILDHEKNNSSKE